MKKSTAAVARKVSKIREEGDITKKTRRVLRPRAARSYYAVSKDELKLYRFSSHYEREFFVNRGELEIIGALDFRNRILSDIEGKLQVIDVRGKFPEQNVNLEHLGVASSSKFEAPKLGGAVIDSSALANVIRTTIQEMLDAPNHVRGEGQPRTTRLASEH